jgi:hypothetical protein
MNADDADRGRARKDKIGKANLEPQRKHKEHEGSKKSEMQRLTTDQHR